MPVQDRSHSLPKAISWEELTGEFPGSSDMDGGTQVRLNVDLVMPSFIVQHLFQAARPRRAKRPAPDTLSTPRETKQAQKPPPPPRAVKLYNATPIIQPSKKGKVSNPEQGVSLYEATSEHPDGAR